MVADIIVETLRSAGVEHCCGVVGDTLVLIAVCSIEAGGSEPPAGKWPIAWCAIGLTDLVDLGATPGEDRRSVSRSLSGLHRFGGGVTMSPTCPI
jgi:hypothetical protein